MYNNHQTYNQGNKASISTNKFPPKKLHIWCLMTVDQERFNSIPLNNGIPPYAGPHCLERIKPKTFSIHGVLGNFVVGMYIAE